MRYGQMVEFVQKGLLESVYNHKMIAAFQTTVLNSGFPQAYFNLGTVLKVEMGDAAGAARAWSKYLELDPNVDPRVKNFLLSEIQAVPGS